MRWCVHTRACVCNGILLSLEGERNPGLCDNADGPRGPCTKRDKSDREGQIPRDLPETWNPKTRKSCGTIRRHGLQLSWTPIFIYLCAQSRSPRGNGRQIRHPQSRLPYSLPPHCLSGQAPKFPTTPACSGRRVGLPVKRPQMDAKPEAVSSRYGLRHKARPRSSAEGPPLWFSLPMPPTGRPSVGPNDTSVPRPSPSSQRRRRSRRTLVRSSTTFWHDLFI